MSAWLEAVLATEHEMQTEYDRERAYEAADARDYYRMVAREVFKLNTGAPVTHQIMAGEGRGVP